ncbi:MAG: hypothetical protein ACI4R9_09695 [Kiritimatiellia bacterium]
MQFHFRDDICIRLPHHLFAIFAFFAAKNTRLKWEAAKGTNQGAWHDRANYVLAIKKRYILAAKNAKDAKIAKDAKNVKDAKDAEDTKNAKDAISLP